MKTLYIHGLDSSPKEDKIAVLKSIGLEVVALHIDYRTEKEESYKQLKEFALENNVEFIIGSSMGGMWGFYLSEYLGVPCLLFNPAMHFSKFEIKHPQRSGVCPLRFVVLGDQDESVDPVRNHNYFTTLPSHGTQQRIVRCHWLEHRISVATLKQMTILAISAME